MSGFVTLQEAADRLGVHYMTAYRYVRMGQLPAHKEGGTWRIATGDLDLFQQGNASEPSQPLSRKTAPWSERFENRLLEGDQSGAWRVVEGALTAGMTPHTLYCDVFGPALASIGRRWESGEVGIAEEHQASVIMGRLIGRLGPRFSPRGRRRGTVVVTGAPGDRHYLGLAMAADLLRGSGYSVMDLGGDLPVGALTEVLGRLDGVKAVCIGVFDCSALDDCREMVAAARRHLDGACPVVLGGWAIEGDDHAHRLGADRWADLAHLVEAVEAGRRQAPPAVWV